MKPLPFLRALPQRTPSRPAVIVPVQQTEPEQLRQACAQIAESGVADVIEWRIDPLAETVLRASTEPADRRSQTDPQSPVPDASSAQADDRALVQGFSSSQANERTTAQEGIASDPVSIVGTAVVEAVRELAPTVASAGLPVLLTLRTGGEGGEVEISDADYAAVIRQIAEAGLAEAVDVEIARTASRDLIAAVHAAGCAIVASRHNFSSTDSVATMRQTLSEMRDAGADVVKIAMMPTSPADVTDLLRATAEADASLDCPVIGIAMGEAGRASRILGADFGSCATFAQMGTASAPGQIDATELAAMLDALYP